jgi:hypothetical protein
VCCSLQEDVSVDWDSWLFGATSILPHKYLKFSFRNVLETRYDCWTGKEGKPERKPAKKILSRQF